MRRAMFVFAALLAMTAMTAAAENQLPRKLPTLAPGEHILGKDDAPVTIIEYASLTCGHCAAFDMEKMPRIRQDWIETGRAKLAYRDFPVDGLAVRAAVLAHCVPPERYFGLLDLLYKEQGSWMFLPDRYQAVRRVACLGGVTDAVRVACLGDAGRIDSMTAERQAAGKEYGIDSIPTFFVDGIKIEGDVPYEDFENALTAAFSRR